MKLYKNITKIIFILFLIFLLFYICLDSYYYFDRLYPSVKSFNNNPEAYYGVKIEKVGRMKNIVNDTFILLAGNEEVMVKTGYSDIKPVKKGFVIINGIYNKDGYIDMIDIHYSPYHYIKYFISLMALIITLVYLFKEWRLTKRGLISNA